MADKTAMAEEARLKKFSKPVTVLCVEANEDTKISSAIFDSDQLGHIWLQIKQGPEENNIFTILNSAFLSGFSGGNLQVHVSVENVGGKPQVVQAFYDVPNVPDPSP